MNSVTVYRHCLQLVLAVVSILLIRTVICYVRHRTRAHKLRRKAAEKRRHEQKYIQNQITDLEDVVNEKAVGSVLKFNGPELVDEYRSRRLKATDVLRIYVLKACKVTLKFNCVTEIIKNCTAAAESLPPAASKDLPLYGIPVTIKESLETEGAPSTIGWAHRLDNVATDDCVLVKVLKHCGAVPFAKTNVPQMTLRFEGSNPIFGETSNPHNPAFGPGGSTSGEGCVISAGASVLGFGTDTGGSIRVPSHICGICGFKPTKNRLSHVGLIGPHAMTTIAGTVGPMARDVDTLVMAMRAICCDKMFELDPSVVPLKFREEMFACTKSLRIGFFDDNGYLKPAPACQRAVKITKEALEGAGHTLVSFEVSDVERLMKTISEALLADGGETCVTMLQDEEVDRRQIALYKKWTMPNFLRRLIASCLRLKSPRIADDLMAYGGDTSTFSCWQNRKAVEEYKSRFWKDWREKYKLDALICPAFPVAACLKGTLADTTGLCSYTAIFNAFDCPAGTVPVSKVTQKDIDDLQNYQGHYGDKWDLHIKTISFQSIGMPVGVQCVSSPFKEEVCLRLMKEVETLLSTKKS